MWIVYKVIVIFFRFSWVNWGFNKGYQGLIWFDFFFYVNVYKYLLVRC